MFFITMFCGCKKQKNVENQAKELISQNINTLIDSIEVFDSSKIIGPEKFKDFKTKKITVGLLDSVIVENTNFKKFENDKFLKFNISKNEIVTFNSDYNINLLKLNNYDINILFVRFSNFKINDNNASIIVKKVIGISMVKNIFYFKKENDKWVFQKKVFLEMG